MGARLIAINVFISALIVIMIIAAVVGMALGLLISFLKNISDMLSIDWVTFVLEKINPLTYYTNFTYGILSITDIVFFLTVAGLFLFFTVRVLEKRRWS